MPKHNYGKNQSKPKPRRIPANADTEPDLVQAAITPDTAAQASGSAANAGAYASTPANTEVPASVSRPPDDSAAASGENVPKRGRFSERSVFFKVSMCTFLVGALLLLFDRLLDSLGDLIPWMRAVSSALMTTMMPFIVAVVIAYLFRPIVNKLSEWIGRIPVHHKSGEITTLERFVRSRRLFSTAAIFSILFLIIGVVLIRVLPDTLRNAMELIQNMPTYIKYLLNWVDGNIVQNQNLPLEWRSAIESGVNTVNQQLNAWIRDIVSMVPALLRQVVEIGTFTVQMLLAFVLAFYLICDEGKMFRSFNEWVGTKMGRYRSRRVFRFMLDLDNMFSNYIISRLLESLIVGVLCFVILGALGIPYSMLLSVFYAFTNMVPYVGPVVGMVPVLIVAVLTSVGPFTPIWAAVALTVVQGFDAWILSPKLLGDSMGLNPFWVILALVVGSALFGVIGLLLSTPIMAVLMNMINRSIEERRQRGEEVLNPLDQ